MIGRIETGSIRGVDISAVIHEGYRITADGQRCRLAVIAEDGTIVADGAEVEREAFAVAVASYKQMLRGMGHLRVGGARVEEAAA